MVNGQSLERVADGEVKRLGILETVNIEIARLRGFVRTVEGEPPVESDHQEPEVIAQADTCAEGHLIEQTIEFEGTVLIEAG